MADDNNVPPLTKRAPGESGRRRPAAQRTGVVLPESVVQRVRAALESSREQDPDFQKVAPIQAAPALPEAPDAAEAPSVPEEAPGVPEEALSVPEEAPRVPEEAPRVPQTLTVPEALKVTEPAAFQDEPGQPGQAAKQTTPPSPWFPVNPDDDTTWFATISIPESASGGAGRRSPAAVRGTRAPTAGSSQTATRVPVGRRYRVAGVFISVVVLAATGSVAFVLSRHGGGGSSGSTSSYQPPAPTAQSIRNRAASWVASQVSTSAVVSCDPAMCQVLKAQGIPPGRLLILRSGRTDPLRSKVIVATGKVRSEFGRRLTSVYAPAVIASFGSGNLRVDIRVTARHGAARYLANLSSDMLTRKSSGSELVRTQLIRTSAVSRAQLIEGRVDWRLLYTIANLAAVHQVFILAFSDSGPDASPGMPLRAVELAETANGAGAADPAYVQSMVKALHGQGWPYVPAHIQTVRVAGGRAALRVEFAAPSPVDLLTPLAPDLP
jgi:hypothetical protein